MNFDCQDCGHSLDSHDNAHPHACGRLGCECKAHVVGVDFGPNDLTLTQRLRSTCLAYTALILIHSAANEPMTEKEKLEVEQAMAAVAFAGHSLVEAARARSN